MDIGEVDGSQSAPAKPPRVARAVAGEGVGHQHTSGAVVTLVERWSTSRRIAPKERAMARTARVSTRAKARGPGGTRATGTKERAAWAQARRSLEALEGTTRTRFAPWTSRRRRLSSRWSARDVLDGGPGGRACTPPRGFLVQAEEAGRSLLHATSSSAPQHQHMLAQEQTTWPRSRAVLDAGTLCASTHTPSLLRSTMSDTLPTYGESAIAVVEKNFEILGFSYSYVHLGNRNNIFSSTKPTSRDCCCASVARKQRCFLKTERD